MLDRARAATGVAVGGTGAQGAERDHLAAGGGGGHCGAVTRTGIRCVRIDGDGCRRARPDPAVGCLRHPIQYAVDVPEGTISWNLDIRVYRSGRLEDTLTPNRFSGAPATGTVYLDICATDDPEGTWTLQPVVTRWTGSDGVAHETEIPGTPSTFEVGEIIPLACPSCAVSSQVTLRFAKASGRWHAKLALVNRYAGEPLRIWEARLYLDKKTSHGWSRVATVLTDRYGRAEVTRGLRPGRVYQASYGGGWIQYDDDNRLSVPKARSPRVRAG